MALVKGTRTTPRDRKGWSNHLGWRMSKGKRSKLALEWKLGACVLAKSALLKHWDRTGTGYILVFGISLLINFPKDFYSQSIWVCVIAYLLVSITWLDDNQGRDKRGKQSAFSEFSTLANKNAQQCHNPSLSLLSCVAQTDLLNHSER